MLTTVDKKKMKTRRLKDVNSRGQNYIISDKIKNILRGICGKEVKRGDRG